MAVNVDELKSTADVDMFVRIRYAVLSNALLPGIEAEGAIQNLKWIMFEYYLSVNINLTQRRQLLL